MKNHLKIGKNDFQEYLKNFRKEKYFAAIKAGGECLDESLEVSLRMLHNFGLYPVLVHGGGKQIDSELKKEGIEIRKIDGKRVTDEKTLDVVVKTLHFINGNFVNNLNNGGIIAKGINEIFGQLIVSKRCYCYVVKRKFDI